MLLAKRNSSGEEMKDVEAHTAEGSTRNSARMLRRRAAMTMRAEPCDSP